MKFSAPVPRFRMFDVAKAKEFYVDFLGFTLDWEEAFGPGAPLYLQLSRDACVLHLSEHFGDCCPGGAIVIPVDDIDTYQQGLLAKQYKHARPGRAEKMPWGARVLTITDPFGNKITFSQPVSS